MADKLIMKYKLDDIVRVVWEYSAAKALWVNPSSIDAFLRPHEAISVGIVIHVSTKHANYITIAQSIGYGNEIISGQLSIPGGAILQLKVLE